ncbi:catechol 2,3-dioxygenase-like lactoylglutathione lyase family enzyme [Bradyrhizobium diazoefficiens]
MITGLDHVVALVRDIGAAKAAYQTLLGRAPAWQNSGEGADRVLFTLENMTIELMAPSGFSVTADRMRALLDDQEGVLASLCFRVADMTQDAPAAGAGGPEAGSGCRGRKQRF